ncbi:MAG: aromatic ring-hydroxylating dioxygenase subunit alpha [Alphaproteobacteria bacterium]|nr:aromatic ring-hydroxylating dioxygenase subunit alpha [Alphaproteobacteria bacterium]
MPLLSELKKNAKRERKFTADPLDSWTLPPHYYYDPAIYEKEKREIWFKTWQYVGLVADLKNVGDYFTTQILDQKLFVIRSKDGKIRTFYNVCQHRGHTLFDPDTRGNALQITCKFHAWSYDTFGNLRNAPMSEVVRNFHNEDFCVPEIRTEMLGPMIFVNLDDSAAPLMDQGGKLLQRFRDAVVGFDDLLLARREGFQVKANWKFILDGLECYHCPYIHPQSMGRRDSTTTKTWDAHIEGIWQAHRTLGNYELMDKHPEKFPYPITNATNRDIYVWFMFPNLVFVSRQGPPNFQILHAMPQGPEQSIRYQINFCPNDPPNEFDLGHMNHYRDVVWPQDCEAMEKQMSGIKSLGFRRGRLMTDESSSWWSEEGTHHFNHLVWKSLNGEHYA